MSVILIGVVLVLPVWLVRYPPLADYPSHLASAFVLAHLHDPRFDFSKFYRAQWDANPTILQEGVLVALQSIVPIDLAGRILLSTCLLAPPLAAWLFLRQANPNGDLLVLWTLALSYNSSFRGGFLAYWLGIAACFVALALWLRYLESPGLIRWIGLAIVFTIVYATHLVAFLVAGVVSTTLLMARRRPLLDYIGTWLLFLPGCLLYLHVMWGAGVLENVSFSSVGAKVGWLSGVFSVFRGISLKAYAGTWFLLVISAAVARWRNPDFHWNTEWIAVSVVLLSVYALLPIGYSIHGSPIFVGGVTDRRVLPFLFIVVLATARVGSRGRWVAAIAVLAFLLQTSSAARLFIFRDEPQLARLAASFDAIPAHVRVLPMVEYTRADFDPYHHFWANGLVERGWLCPYLFTIPGVNPLRLRDEVYAPEGYWIRYEKGPDWERVRASYEYVWAFNVRRFSPQLRAIGELVFADDVRIVSDMVPIHVYRMNKRAAPGGRP